MRSIRILPLLAMVPLLGCDGTGEWLRRPGAATAYAAPLASDTTVVSTRRVWSSAGSGIYFATIMPNGAGVATTHWETGNPAIFDLASKKFRPFRVNDEPYDTGLGLYAVPSPDGSRVAVHWQNHLEPQMQLRILDVATGESRTIMTPDTATARDLVPVAWTPAGDSVFARLDPSYSKGGDVQVVLIPTAGGTPRMVHTISPKNMGGPWRMSLSSDGRWLLYD
ncbi:MAG: hypothetical protein LC667_10215, partial [Thioalkalivibrio sp.]|nr:hypothetical protein [Thioalkalivibrio sp.]